MCHDGCYFFCTRSRNIPNIGLSIFGCSYVHLLLKIFGRKWRKVMSKDCFLLGALYCVFLLSEVFLVLFNVSEVWAVLFVVPLFKASFARFLCDFGTVKGCMPACLTIIAHRQVGFVRFCDVHPMPKHLHPSWNPFQVSFGYK